MSSTLLGMVDWNGSRDIEGHREYKAQWLVESNDIDDGPSVIFTTAGLPAIGSYWDFGNDLDAWAYCMPDWKITPAVTKEPNELWIVEQTFSTKPMKRCQDTAIENPLSEPARLSGSFVTFSRECMYDRFGDATLSSSFELLRGPSMEMDDARPTVQVGLNFTTLPLSLFSSMLHTVNDATLWGLPARCVKLSNATWTRQLYGTCTFYYTVDYDFDIRYDTFDVDVLDEGSRVLAPGGTPTNPRHFTVYKDLNGENTRCILDGSGEAWDGTGSPGVRHVEKYNESNLLLLGIPTSL